MIRNLKILILSLLAMCLAARAGTIKPEIEQLRNESRTAFLEIKKLEDEYFFFKIDPALLTADEKSSLIFQTDLVSHELEKIFLHQNEIKKYIEEYEGVDWEEKFGDEKLWEQISADIVTTVYRKVYADLVHADLNFESGHEGELFRDLNLLESLDVKPAETYLLTAKIYRRLAESDPSLKRLARRELLAVEEDMAANDLVRLNTAVELMLLNGDITEIYDRVKTIEDCNQIQNVLAVLHRRVDTGSLLKMTESCPKVSDLYGRAMLRILMNSDDPAEAMDCSMVQLAVSAMLKYGNPGDHTGKLEKLAEAEKFHSFELFYAAGIAFEQKSWQKAFEFQLKALKKQPGNSLNIKRKRVLNHLLYSGYELYKAGELKQNELGEIARLADSRLDEGEMRLVGRFLVNAGMREMGLQILEDYGGVEDLGLKLVKMSELKEKGRLKEAIEVAATLDQSGLAKGLDIIKSLLFSLLKQQDEINHSEKYVKMCQKLAEKCSELAEDDAEIFLMLGEYSVRAGLDRNNKVFDEILGKISSAEHIETRAEILTYIGRYSQAAKAWQQLINRQSHEHRQENLRNPVWWRGKYFQLYCLYKQGDIPRQKLDHAVDVLLNSCESIPGEWEKKLSSLKNDRS